MLPFDRHRKIIETLENKEFVHLEELSEALEGVSVSTIRRDLRQLESEGAVRMLRGGVTKAGQGSYDGSFILRDNYNVTEKERIAKCAAGLVREGEVVYIDSGSTNLRVVKHLLNKKVTIVTSNAMVYGAIQGSDCQCILTGGELCLSTASLLGPIAEDCLRKMFFDIAFLGASGFSAIAGVNTMDPMEASKKQIVRTNAKRCYLLADSSKAEVITLCKAFELNEAAIICDREVPVLEMAREYMIAP